MKGRSTEIFKHSMRGASNFGSQSGNLITRKNEIFSFRIKHIVQYNITRWKSEISIQCNIVKICVPSYYKKLQFILCINKKLHELTSASKKTKTNEKVNISTINDKKITDSCSCCGDIRSEEHTSELQSPRTI